MHDYYSDERGDVSKRIWMTQAFVLHLSLSTVLGFIMYFSQRHQAQSSGGKKTTKLFHNNIITQQLF